MNSSENLRNALQVMYQTYDNVQKLMSYCITFAKESTKYRCFSDKFLRWKSDSYTAGWLTNSFILLFQNENSEDCESRNGWKKDAVYAMEICLGEKGKDNKPLIYLSKFEYYDINKWSEGCSPSNHWIFSHPTRIGDIMEHNENGDYRIGNPKSTNIQDKYWGLKKVTTRTISLFDITAENVNEKIFNEFDQLANM